MLAGVAEYMFNMLQGRIGSEVTCMFWCHGKKITTKGILKEVDPFHHVNIDDNIITFVGQRQAIESIKLSDGRTVYTCPEAHGYDLKDIREIMDLQEKMLGRSVVREEMYERIRQKQKVKRR